MTATASSSHLNPALTASTRWCRRSAAPGFPSSCTSTGAFPLPPGIDLSAYRIVQEGLTNAIKHAGASHADVTIRYGPDEVGIEVRDDGTT